MLAIDQREALRAMMAVGRPGEVADADLTRFKVSAAKALSSHASAILIDKQFAWDAVVDAAVVDPSCAMIAAVDAFTPSEDEFVAESVIDEELDFAELKRQGAKALKLLVLWRPDTDASERIAMVDDFVARCRAHDLVSVVEPVSRGRRDKAASDLEAGILSAARELGDRGADIYKSEVPTHGTGTDAEINAKCRELTDAINGQWVVLSSGVDAERFPEVVDVACRAGASGFLAGRAVWASVVTHDDWDAELERVSIPRLERLAAIVDDAVTR